MLSDESSFTLFATLGRVYVWRTPKEVYNSECLVPTVKHGRSSVMVWVTIPWYNILLVPLLSFMAELQQGSKYVDRLGNQMHLMIQNLCLNNGAVFQGDNVPIHAVGTVQSWFQEHKYELQHLL
jgi:hypothetical protein